MQSLEQALRKLVARLIGKALLEVPQGEMEQIIGFAADNISAGGGASITALTLTTDSEGKVVSGTATLSDESTIPITVTTE